MSDWSRIAAAYDAGRLNLIGEGSLASGREGIHWLMPWAVTRARARGATSYGAQEVPVAAALTVPERAAITYLHGAMAERPVSDYSLAVQLFGEVYPAQSSIYTSVTENHQFDRSLLNIDQPSGVQHGKIGTLFSSLSLLYFLIKKDQLQRSRKIPPIDAAAGDPELKAWLKRYPDPDLWHVMVAEFNYDLPDVWKLFEWIVAQPQCGRATAALLFLQIDGPRIIGLSPGVPGKQDKSAKLAIKIVTRSEGPKGFPENLLSLSDGRFADDQRPLLAKLRAKPMAVDGVPVPERLLGEPFSGRAAQTATSVHSECCITRER
jgi:hypothetical protein